MAVRPPLDDAPPVGAFAVKVSVTVCGAPSTVTELEAVETVNPDTVPTVNAYEAFDSRNTMVEF